ncbi:MAG: hypothetical protein A2849_01445 [Candidatus Taylorbacteria bacterium RIFCSPHIGHO2_01_FULL_51_15]|uniref:Uncharacterized protein n=1 Tax=Candidatus Taylorbacteria bacterium RIFCSPHIGHO2_01_FULL_51_15 TaxID=1802304 RepID=A0A1G2M9K9_9BACT|nr:MAG: hypothetical protein A2849_01445 [Candidatus Taylorbacteria bacterium RIFCSPHIGHO2_01_FULL_51_15]
MDKRNFVAIAKKFQPVFLRFSRLREARAPKMPSLETRRFIPMPEIEFCENIHIFVDISPLFHTRATHSNVDQGPVCSRSNVS